VCGSNDAHTQIYNLNVEFGFDFECGAESMIRLATKEDIPQIVWCDRTAVSDSEVVGYGLPSGKRVFANEDKLRANWQGDYVEGRLVYVFEEDRRVLGFIQVRVDPDAVELYDVDVASEHQSRGIGRALVDFVENLAKNLGKHYVTLGTSRNLETGRPWKSYSFWQVRLRA
jgi:ribosomal protein S18 acetylase RimI-like enzyme